MNKGKKLISVLLAFVLSVCFSVNASAVNLKNEKDKANKLETQQNEIEAEQKSAEAKVKALAASMKQMSEQLDRKLEEIAETDEELLATQVKLSDQNESMRLRIRYMYENGNVDILSLLFESENITDFLSKAEYVAKMSEYDRKKLEEYQRTVRLTEEKELELQAEYKELENLQNSLLQQQEEAKELLAKKDAELSRVAAELKTVKAQIARAEEEARQQAEAEASKNNSNTGSSVQESKPPAVSGNGYFTHPCPGMTRQSSSFGEIRQNVGNTKPHKGNDYAAPEGTPIYAAAAGTVISAGYAGEAGYRVVINHGNGLVTRYMHMYKQPLVKAGQKVQKGQHIGGVGSTGRSTGNHLHFQVEENGTPVNPSKYL